MHEPPSFTETSRRPVVIAGGGPVGLTLAALLSHRGIRSVVIEADEGYCTGSRAICVARRSLEVLAWAGADRHLSTLGLPWVGGRSYYRDTEVLHFRMPSDAGDRFPPMINVQQFHVEEAAHRAIVDGLAEVRWSTRVVAVAQDADGVRVEVVDASGRRSSIESDWLVACDGGRSTVRGQLGLSLQGVEYEGRYVIVDIEQDTRRDVERLAWFDPPSNPGSTILMHRQPGNVWRIDYQLRDDEDPALAVLPEHVLPRVQSHLAMIGENAPWKPLWISIYNAKCLTLPDYRSGRVLFAGDAAHLVPIFGVRGLNSGIDDAGNLAWKLAAVIEGRANATLLDSYTRERLHAARENMAYGAKSTEFMAPPHAGFALMREAALRLALDDETVRPLINPRQTKPVAYPSRGPATGLCGFAATGEIAPDALIEGPDVAHLSPLFGRGFVVLTFGDAAHPSLPRAPVWRVTRSGAATSMTLVDRDGEAWRRYAAREGTAVLIRPDGYVAARFDHFDPVEIDAQIDVAMDAPMDGATTAAMGGARDSTPTDASTTEASDPRKAEDLESLYARLSQALGDSPDDRRPLLLATLALDLLAHRTDGHAADAIARAERLCKV
jgi:3-(3-hydroxy-phenyl)propionate hydroxylase